jgi:hypothetical protein
MGAGGAHGGGVLLTVSRSARRTQKNGSRVLTTVTIATGENATPVQILSFCKPRIMADMTDRTSDASLTALGLPRLGQRGLAHAASARIACSSLSVRVTGLP